MPTLTLSLNLLHSPDGFTGWISEFPGVVAQGGSIEEVKAELIETLQVKLKVEAKEGKKESPSHNINVITEKLELAAQI